MTGAEFLGTFVPMMGELQKLGDQQLSLLLQMSAQMTPVPVVLLACKIFFNGGAWVIVPMGSRPQMISQHMLDADMAKQEAEAAEVALEGYLTNPCRIQSQCTEVPI